MRLVRRSLALLVMAVVCSMISASFAQEVENPVYKAWASFKVGSNKTLASESGAGGYPIQMEMKQTLVDKAGDHVTVETQSRVMVGGQWREGTPHRQNYNAKVSNTEGWHEVGEENVQAMGRNFKCKVYEGKSAVPSRGGAPQGTEAKIYASPDVPGGVVQIKVTPQANGRSMEMVYLLKDFQAK